MLPEISEDREVVPDGDLESAEGCCIEAVAGVIDLALDAEGLAGIPCLVLMVEVLDGLFEAYGNEEPEDNGRDVDEEVAPRVGGVMGGMYIQHLDVLLLNLQPVGGWIGIGQACSHWLRRGRRQHCRAGRGV